MADQNILSAQQWLNSTYGTRQGWVPVPESGQTGWNTIYGLRRGLQAELGISPVSSGFGPATTEAFKTKIGTINGASAVGPNILRILSAALFCKGYPGVYAGQDVSFATMSSAISTVRDRLGLAGSAQVDVKLMSSLLTMDAYTIPYFSNGTQAVREVQQWLNGTYSHRRDFDLIPCDGMFSRQVQKALLLAIQYDAGMADGVANGNFGPGTRDKLRSAAVVAPGSRDGQLHFVRLYQAAMRFNRLEVPFSGVFDGAVEASTRDFQGFMQIPETGRGDYTTWCTLLVSSGDTTIKTKGFDTNRPLSSAMAVAAKASGYTHIGRYTAGNAKFISARELQALKDSGLKLFPIHQRFNNAPDQMTKAKGLAQGLEALERCRVLGIPNGSIVFFCVDFDALGETIQGPILDFFEGVNEVMDSTPGVSYRVGVYGTRNVCQVVTEAGMAHTAFVAGMSTGWSGNLGFAMPPMWSYNQIVEVNETFAGNTIGVDHVVVSRDAAAVDLSSVTPPPTYMEATATETGFDYFFEWAVRAEVAVEREIVKHSTPSQPIAGLATLNTGHILEWLRKPAYEGLLWTLYLVDVNTDEGHLFARQVAVAALRQMSPSKPLPPYGAPEYDVAHFAAAALGYRYWGRVDNPLRYGLSELASWPLDLLSAWGIWERLPLPKPGLQEWMDANLGVTDDSGFGYSDFLVDADAYLFDKDREASGGGFSEALRHLFKNSASSRIGRFYAERFAGKPENIVTQFQALVDGLDVGAIESNAFSEQLIEASGAERLPTPAEAAICAQSFARALTRLGS